MAVLNLKPSIFDMTETLRLERNPMAVQTRSQFAFLFAFAE